jgi:hypothetical protein
MNLKRNLKEKKEKTFISPLLSLFSTAIPSLSLSSLLARNHPRTAAFFFFPRARAVGPSWPSFAAPPAQHAFPLILFAGGR